MISISALTACLPLRAIGLPWLSRWSAAGGAATGSFAGSVGRPDKAATDIAAMREFARRQLKTNPGFAADLRAAADRHETLIASGGQP